MMTTPPDTRRVTFRRLERAALVVSLVAICAVHGPLIGYKMYANVDEAYASAIGERLLEGFKLYDGAVSQRGPLMYYAYEAIAWMHGWDSVVALRVWALVFSLAHLVLVWWMARRLLSRETAVIAVSLTGYALSFGFPPFDAYALHGETLQLPALLGAVSLGALAIRRPPSPGRRWRLAAAGLLFGVAASIKQSVLLHPLPLLAWIAIDARRRRTPPGAVVGDLAVLAVSILLVPLAFVANAAREGTLGRLYYFCFTYNREIHLHPSTKSFSWLPNVFFRLGEQTSFFIVTAMILAISVPWFARRARAAWRLRSLASLGRGFGVQRYFVLHFIVAAASAAGMYRFFPHYFLQAWPFAALSLAAPLGRIARSRRFGASMRHAVVAFLGFCLFCGYLGTVFGERIDGRVMHDRTVNDLSKIITATTSPSDRIFVWGFSPWVYEYSHRRPAGRYVFETYVTGFVPWFWEKMPVERARIVPGSVEALLGDLDRETPSVVVDAGSIVMGRPMRAYAPFSDWLHAHYCFDFRLGAFDLYRRKAADAAACPIAAFPRPHAVVDWSGRALPAALPVLADEESTRRLPEGNYFKPLWFRGQPTPRGLDAMRDAHVEKDENEARQGGFRVEDFDPEAPADP